MRSAIGGRQDRFGELCEGGMDGSLGCRGSAGFDWFVAESAGFVARVLVGYLNLRLGILFGGAFLGCPFRGLVVRRRVGIVVRLGFAEVEDGWK